MASEQREDVIKLEEFKRLLYEAHPIVSDSTQNQINDLKRKTYIQMVNLEILQNKVLLLAKEIEKLKSK